MKFVKADITVLPVSYIAAKRRCKVDGEAHQETLTSLIKQVTDDLEGELGAILSPRECVVTFYDRRNVYTLVGPVRSITSVKNSAGDDVEYTLSYVGNRPQLTASNTDTTLVVTYEAGELVLSHALQMLLLKLIQLEFDGAERPNEVSQMILRNTVMRL